MHTIPVSESADTPLISFRNITKTFGGAHALTDVSFVVRAGVVHGLVGANGAGKSTLIRCLAGIVQPDTGSIVVDGDTVAISDARTASDLGFAFIHQEMSLIPGWDVLKNLTIGVPMSTMFGFLSWRPMKERAAEAAARVGITFPLSTPVDSLSTAEKWLVLIARALMLDARVIAMDEPTASLSSREAERLHSIIRGLAAEGTAVIFVSHRLDEVSELCTDVTVFRDGAVTRRSVGEPLSKADLIRAIVGKDLEIPEHGHDPVEHGAEVLRVDSVGDDSMVHDVSLNVHAGEVVGIGGLVGAGRSELVRSIYGATRRTRGSITFLGKQVEFSSPADAVRAGIGLVPEERRAEGLFIDESISFNILIASLDSFVRTRLVPLLDMRRAKNAAQAVADRVTVKARRVEDEVGILSGGNQQKVAIARWLVEPPKLLILDEPSRGVDVGARAEVHSVIRALAASGAAVLVVSSDNEELVALCDRVYVMTEGRVSGQVSGHSNTVDHIVQLSFTKQSQDSENPA